MMIASSWYDLRAPLPGMRSSILLVHTPIARDGQHLVGSVQSDESFSTDRIGLAWPGVSSPLLRALRLWNRQPSRTFKSLLQLHFPLRHQTLLGNSIHFQFCAVKQQFLRGEQGRIAKVLQPPLWGQGAHHPVRVILQHNLAIGGRILCRKYKRSSYRSSMNVCAV